jgi:hypothetical protein
MTLEMTGEIIKDTTNMVLIHGSKDNLLSTKDLSTFSAMMLAVHKAELGSTFFTSRHVFTVLPFNFRAFSKFL